MSLVDVGGALEAEGLTRDVAAAVTAALPAGWAGAASVQWRVVESARAMTAVGVGFGVQRRVFFRAFGVGIAGGGGAGFDPDTPEPEACPWCGGTGSHGGWCPGPYLDRGPRPWLRLRLEG